MPRSTNSGFIESPYRKVKKGRVVDFVTVTNGAGSGLEIGKHLDRSVVDKKNRQLKAQKNAW